MMKQTVKILLAVAAVLMVAGGASAQTADSTTVDKPSGRRFITPVAPKTNVTLLPGKDVDEKALELYLTGDTLQAMKEQREDSIRHAYTRYPKLTESYVGFNFIDLLLMACGQDHMNVDFSFTMNMWNRLQPVAELGVGYARLKDDDHNFTYHGKFAPYVKLGANYNFMFKNSPDYQAFLGVRLGGSLFRYDIADIKYSNSYWGEEVTTAIKGTNGRALWFEALAGLKVKIHREWALGWQIKYHSLLAENKQPSGKPWFVPGYGTRNGSIGFAFNVYYTFPTFLRTPMPAAADKDKTSITDVK